MKKILIVFLLLTYTVNAQNTGVIRSDAPNIFIDCQKCDVDFIKDNIPFVNFVWDRKNADVHILFSKLKTGGGGEKYTLSFIGANKFENMNDTLNFVQTATESDDDTRKKILQIIKLGLVKYLARTPLANNINVSFNSSNNNKKNEIKDEWDYWVFRTKLKGFLYGEESRNNIYLSGSFSANRITEEWKIKLSLHGNYNENSFNYSGNEIVSISRYQGFYSSIIKSYNNHFSYGLFTRIYSSVYNNVKLGLVIAPGIEYNIFPFTEATSRQLRIAYKVFLAYNNYNEETIYFKNEELLGSEKLSITLELVQPWGTIETELSGAHYFHDLNLNSVELNNELRINILKGLTINLQGSFAYIHDQIALPKGDIDLEEVLLQRKQLQTEYEFYMSIGFTYSFGSIYNNIVNTRFGN